ncbi:cytochrome-c peroxidase [Phaeobacter porticola]|uniref:Putative cytochrome c peroxidase n=1 Tax=Phaeobacter porticola TaxID=1844006 RepID=A0A1L3IA25_9RHOB|nr:cytochrome c peroxidase [Phaeobacter porticola]APG48946.1 putative cytochrome c peroxidase [Phaeobacter porticola]
MIERLAMIGVFSGVLICVSGAVVADGSSQIPDLGPRPEFAPVDPVAAELGQLLFYDPILSGNRNISCASCHHPRFGTGDGVSLSLGEGAAILGAGRRVNPDNVPEQRIPRNAPSLWNLGAEGMNVMFHDGRLEADPAYEAGIRTPLEGDMVAGFDSALSAQAMFPVLSADEMAGHYGENDISRAVRLGQLSHPGGAWDLIAARVAEVAAYRQRFDEVIGTNEPIRFTDIGNMLAAFIRFEWRADDSPFDRAMMGHGDLPVAAARGQALFYGVAGCSACHSGWLQTDNAFYAIAMPQLGPGKAARFETHARDDGRLRVTGDPADAYRFRTPSLRNVALTAPYGHSGAYATLEAVVRHHLDPVTGLDAYDRSQIVLPTLAGAYDWVVMDDQVERDRIAAANDLAPVVLNERDLADLVAFLGVLTDSAAAAGRLGVPETVPSGLPVEH